MGGDRGHQVEKVKLLKLGYEEAAREKMTEKEALLALVCFLSWRRRRAGDGVWLVVTAIVGEDGGLEVGACEVGATGKGDNTAVIVAVA